jgi:protoporphyrinogen oxidase
VRDGRVVSVVAGESEQTRRVNVGHVFSTIPLPLLVRAMQPSAPHDVLAAAAALQYRAMILVYLVLETDRFTEYDAHYFPDSGVTMTRLSEPKNYGLAEAPGRTVLCAELPCSTADAVWSMSDAELGELIRDDLARVGLPIGVPLVDVATRRLRQAYPIYSRGFQADFNRLDEWVGGIRGLTTLGRQGLFAHDNTHHTLAMAYAAVDCLDAAGRFDDARWQTHRREFESHVVED